MEKIKELLLNRKKEKGEVSYSDIDELIKNEHLDDSQLDELIIWITENDLNITLNDSLALDNPYFRDISIYPLLSKQEEIELAKRIKNGDKLARDKFIKSNLRLVVQVAKNYYCNDLSFNDLIQEGNIGLFKAVDKYDASLNVPFNFYASFWIKKSILEAIYKSQIINVPERIRLQIKKIEEVSSQFQEKNNRLLESKEIAEILNISKERVEQLQNYKYTFESIDDEHKFENLFTSNLALDPFTTERIFYLIKKLKKRDQEIISYYYGLANYPTLNMQQIADKYNLSKQRVNQIIKNALEMIKEQYDK